MNIEVTGSGTETPEGVVGTSLYTVEDVIFNPYSGSIDYPIPGPALWTGGSGSGSGSSPAPPTAGNGTAPATPTAPAATSAAATSAAASSAASVIAEATPTAEATPAPSSGAGELPKTFTIETFIAWLEEAAGPSGNANARRHARSLFF